MKAKATLTAFFLMVSILINANGITFQRIPNGISFKTDKQTKTYVFYTDRIVKIHTLPSDVKTKEKTELVINSIHAVGAAGLCGADWDPTANEMTLVEGFYVITFENVAAGTYEFKFAANGEWTYDWASGIEIASGAMTIYRAKSSAL